MEIAIGAFLAAVLYRAVYRISYLSGFRRERARREREAAKRPDLRVVVEGDEP